MQVPCWLLVIAYGLALRHPDDGVTQIGNRSRQFGIGQLMFVTLVIAIVLGVGRAVFTSWMPSLFDRDLATFAFLAIAAILMTLPLILAALLPRLAALAVCLVLVFAAVATAWESALFETLGGNGPDALHFHWINVFTAAWVLAFGLATRLSGYRLTTPQSPAMPTKEPI